MFVPWSRLVEGASAKISGPLLRTSQCLPNKSGLLSSCTSGSIMGLKGSRSYSVINWKRNNLKLLSTPSSVMPLTLIRHESTVSAEFLPDTRVQVEIPSPTSALEYMEMNSSISDGVATIFSNTGPVLQTVDVLCMLKDLDGMTWVQVIFYGTIAIRLVIGLPIAVTQQKAISRLENLQPEIKDLAENLKKETGYAIKKFGWDEATAKRQFRKSYKKHWRNLVEEHNCHPMRSLCLGILQIPAWICFSSALRNIVYAVPLPRTEEKALRWMEMHQEGTPWIANLTTSDPYVLPLVFMTANLVNIRVHSYKKALAPQSRLQKAIPIVFGTAIVGVSIIACYVPAAVSMYWAVSSSAALAQNLILLKPEVRRFFGIAKTPSTT